ncbi:MAG: permease-like cell division protein FtsX [Clostridia bacterium]|nr:permease-like cell division protein FtsX [Clostridia bacterium]
MKSSSLRYLTKEGFRTIFINRLMSVASVTVLMSCLVIIGIAALIFFNINAVLDTVESQNIIMVYIQDAATPEQTTYAGSVLSAIDNVESCEFVSREEGYAAILGNLGDDAAVFEGMDASFLPNAYRITVKDLSKFDETVAQISAVENVMNVRENSDLAQRLTRIRNALTYASIGMIALLFIVAVFIIANTVRITMFSRRLEISIMKAVGATNAFIRWPFVIEGIVLGIISALVAEGVLYLLYMLASVSFAGVFAVFGTSLVDFGNYALWLLLAFVCIGVFTGMFGSSVSMGRYLREQGKVVNDDD